MAISIVRLGTPRKPAKACALERCGVLRAAFRRPTSHDSTITTCGSRICRRALRWCRKRSGAADDRAWAAFSRKFRHEMNAPDRSRELDLLAALSHQTNLSVGCYCGTRAAVTAPCCASFWRSVGRVGLTKRLCTRRVCSLQHHPSRRDRQCVRFGGPVALNFRYYTP